MTVHLAQIAAVDGPVLYLWDLDKRVSTSASLSLALGIETYRGRLVWLSYEGGQPVSLASAAETDLTPEQRAVMLAPLPSAEDRARRELIWGDA